MFFQVLQLSCEYRFAGVYRLLGSQPQLRGVSQDSRADLTLAGNDVGANG